MEVQKEYVARHREASLRQAAARLSSFNKPKPEFNQTVDIKISDLNWREPVHVDEGEFDEEHGDEDGSLSLAPVLCFITTKKSGRKHSQPLTRSFSWILSSTKPREDI